jgi:chromosome segregation ATPase
MIATLDSSVEVYATLKTALDDLQTKITEAENSKKVKADLLTEAQTLLEGESKKYNDGSLADNDVPASVEAIRNMISKLQEAIDSTATRINAVSTATDADNTYTMGGRKVVGKQKGLVIRNGRKVVVK